MNKKILLAMGLVFGLLPVTRAFAFEDTSRMDILRAKVNALEEKAKANDSKIEALEALKTKISQLESRLDTNDSKMKYMVRQEAELESRVSDLEATRDEAEKSREKFKKKMDLLTAQETT